MVYTRLYMVMHGYTLLYVVIMSLLCLWLSLVLYRIIIMSIGLSGLFLLKAGLVEHVALVQLLYKLKGAYPQYNIVHAGLRNLLCQCP